MPSSRFLISSQTLGSATSSVTFSGIPSSYADLVLRYSARSNASSIYDFLQLRINGLSTTIYSDTVMYGNDGVSFSTRGTNVAQLYAPRFGVDGNTATSNTFSNGEVYIPSYTASQNKPIGMFAAQENNSTDAYIAAAAGLIRETGAVTSIGLTLITGPNFQIGSSFYLYGLKAS